MELYYIIKINKKYLQGRVKVPTGGIAREQFCRFGVTPKPTVKSGWKKVRVKLYKYSIDNNLII